MASAVDKARPRGAHRAMTDPTTGMPAPDQPALRFVEPVTLLGGGPTRAEDLADALALAPRLVCADGGANRLTHRDPDAVIGDLDSLDDPARWRRRLGARLIEVAEQDSTDLEKCLRYVEAPFFIGAGFSAGRVDHLLAALHALVVDPRPIVLIGEDDALFSAGPGVALDLEPGDRVSFFPVRPATGTGSAGLFWPIEGLAMAAGEPGPGRIGTSNRAVKPRVEARFDRPGVVVALPRARLDRVIAAFRGRAVSAPGHSR